jgi:PhzF family phenazine biosynthesis protein
MPLSAGAPACQARAMRAFSQVDVFTADLLLGNPVAVVHAAEGLTGGEMAAFARWTNLSETTFLLPPTDPVADYRLRIFTTSAELPFAGHPTLGSARAWLEAGGVPKDPGAIVQECEVGLVRVRRTGARLAFAAPPLLRGGPVGADDLDRLAPILGLRREEIVDAPPPSCASTPTRPHSGTTRSASSVRPPTAATSTSRSGPLSRAWA